MVKLYKSKKGNEYVLLQVRIPKEARSRLTVLCAELGMTIQKFVTRLLMGDLKR